MSVRAYVCMYVCMSVRRVFVCIRGRQGVGACGDPAVGWVGGKIRGVARVSRNRARIAAPAPLFCSRRRSRNAPRDIFDIRHLAWRFGLFALFANKRRIGPFFAVAKLFTLVFALSALARARAQVYTCFVSNTGSVKSATKQNEHRVSVKLVDFRILLPFAETTHPPRSFRIFFFLYISFFPHLICYNSLLLTLFYYCYTIIFVLY